MPLSAGLAIAAAVFSLALVVGLAMLLPFLRRRETQITLRAAIERGEPLDPAVVDRLLGPELAAQGGGCRDLIVAGVITIFVGVGFAALGFFIFLGGAGAKALYPMLGMGAFIGVIGVGLVVAAWVSGVRVAAGPHDPPR